MTPLHPVLMWGLLRVCVWNKDILFENPWKFVESCVSMPAMSGQKQVRDNIVIATKFAAYPWRLTSGQFVNACKYKLHSLLFYFTICFIDTRSYPFECWFLNRIDLFFRSSLNRMQIEQIGIGQLHWSTAKYAPLQELALWDGLVAMYEKVTLIYFLRWCYSIVYSGLSLIISNCSWILNEFVKVLQGKIIMGSLPIRL